MPSTLVIYGLKGDCNVVFIIDMFYSRFSVLLKILRNNILCLCSCNKKADTNAANIKQNVMTKILKNQVSVNYYKIIFLLDIRDIFRDKVKKKTFS